MVIPVCRITNGGCGRLTQIVLSRGRKITKDERSGKEPQPAHSKSQTCKQRKKAEESHEVQNNKTMQEARETE
jgi:hypothetical protein